MKKYSIFVAFLLWGAAILQAAPMMSATDLLVVSVDTTEPCDTLHFNQYVEACEEYTWINGVTYYESTSNAHDTLTVDGGCLLVLTLHLTIYHSIALDTFATACDHFEWRGTSYTSSTSATSTTSNVTGCDSTVTLHLTVNYSSHRDTVAVACDHFEWRGTNYTSSTSATSTTTNAVGCDSTVTLHLTVGHETHNVIYDTCGSHYTWHGTTYTAAGTYTHLYTNAYGCASSDTLHLVVDPLWPVLVDEEHPFFDGFEDSLHWVFFNRNHINRWCHGTAAPHTGYRSIYISNDNGATNSYTITRTAEARPSCAVYATKLFLLGAGSYSFSYDWRATGELNFDFLRVFLAPPSDTLSDASRLRTTPAGWIQLDNGEDEYRFIGMAGVTSWHTFSIPVDIADSGVYRMVFYWQNDNMDGSNPPAAVDNVSIVKTTCLPPDTIYPAGIPTTTWAAVRWPATGVRYTVAFGTATSPIDMDTFAVTDTTILFNHLSPSTEYHVYVRGWCDGTHVSTWSDMYTFRTACGGLTGVPYTEGFEGSWENIGQFLSARCWSKTPSGGNNPYIATSAIHSHSGRQFMIWGTRLTHTTYLILPQLDTTRLDRSRLYLSFWAAPASSTDDTTSHGLLQVGLMGDDTASFVPIDTIDVRRTSNMPYVHTVWTEYGFDLSAYQGTGTHIALHPTAASEGQIALDDFTIDYIPDLTARDTTVTACDSYTWGESTYTASGIYTQLRRVHGLPVHDTLRLTLHYSATGDTVAVACDSFEWRGTVYTSSTSATSSTSTIFGCDSTVTLQLTVGHETHNALVDTGEYRYTWHGTTYTATGTYVYDYIDAYGCASSDTLHLTIVDTGCAIPTALAASSIGDTFAVITWHGLADDYRVAYGTVTDVDALTRVTATDDSIVLTGLHPDRTYHVYVRALCHASLASAWSQVFTFRTGCATTATVPFFEDFESYTADTAIVLPCWHFTMTGRAAYRTEEYYPQVYPETHFWPPYGSSHCLYLTGDAITELPPMNVPLDSLQLTFFFMTHFSANGNPLEIGVMEGTTFIPVDTVVYNPPQTGETAQTATGYLAGYHGTSRTIAFRNSSPDSTTSPYYLDNIAVDYLPACLPVSHLRATQATTSTVTVDWISVSRATSWEIEYSYAGYTPGGGTTTVVTSHPATLTGLTPGSQYRLRVGTPCGDGTLLWSDDILFATPCDLIHPPYYQDFENVEGSFRLYAGSIPPCWERYSSDQFGYSIPHVVSGRTLSHEADTGHVLAMHSDRFNNTPTGIKNAVLLPQFSCPIDSLTLKFWWYVEDNDPGTFTVGYLLPGDDWDIGFHPLRSFSSVISPISTSGQYDSVVFAGVPATAQHIAFRWECQDYGYHYCLIDNVDIHYTWQETSCNTPTRISSSNVTASTALLSWRGMAPGFIVAYGTGMAPETMQTVHTTGNFVTLTGLSNGTTYHCFVRADCGERQSAWSAANSFTTECALITSLPYTEGFETVPVYHGNDVFELPCWCNVYTPNPDINIPYPVVLNRISHYGDRSLVWGTYDYSSYTGLPAIDTHAIALDSLQLHFWGNGNGYLTHDTMTIGVMRDDDTTTFVPVTTLDISGPEWQLYTVSLRNYTGGGNRFAIHGTGYNNVFLDDFTIEALPPCPAPSEVVVSHVTRHTAEVAWQGTASHYTVAYGTGTTPAAMATVGVTGTTAHLTGLTPNTHYHLFVRADCSLHSHSAWSPMEDFQTDCGLIVSLPYTEDFEDATPSYPQNPDFTVACWRRLTDAVNGYYEPCVLSEALSHSGAKDMIWSKPDNTPYQILVLPAVDTTAFPIHSLRLSLAGLSMPNPPLGTPVVRLQVGVMSDPDDPQTFVPVDTIVIDSAGWRLYSARFSGYSGTGEYVALKMLGSTSQFWCIRIDDVSLQEPLDCSTVLPEVIARDACERYTWHGVEYSATGAYTYDTLIGDECLRSDTLHLTIHHPTTGTDSVTACDRYTWINGITYTTSNHGSTFTLTDTYGCDSTVTLHLTLRHSSHRDTIATACDSFLWRGTSYTSTTSATSTTTNAAGCDSVVTLHLTLRQSSHRDTVATACDSFLWRGTNYTSTTSATSTTSNVFGCDSAVTLHLTVNYGTHNVLYDTAELQYTWHGTTYGYGDDGTYTYDYLNADGCASSDTLHLVILPIAPVLVDELHPFFDDFENGLRWTLLNDTLVNRWCYGTAVNHSGTHSLYISDNHGTTNTYRQTSRSLVFATKLFTLTQGTYSFSYDWRCLGEGVFDKLMVFLAPQSHTISTHTSRPRIEDWIRLDNGSYLSSSPNWNYQYNSVDIAEAGIYQMIFYWSNDANGGHNPPAAIDNVSIVKTTCQPPTNVATSSTPTATSATIGWEPDSGIRYTVAYGTALSPADMDTLSVTSNTATLTGLSPSTAYNVFVRVWCDNSHVSAWSNMYTFRTACGPLTALPYYEDFEGYETIGSFNVDCWNRVNAYNSDRNTAIICEQAYITHSGTKFIGWANYAAASFYNSTYLVLPQINTDSHALNNLCLRFWARSSDPQQMQVGVMNGATDTSSFQQVGTIDILSYMGTDLYYNEYGISLESYTGTGSFIALHLPPSDAFNFRIDDVTIDYIPNDLIPNDTTVAACKSYTWGDSTYTASGIYTRMRRIHGLPVYDTLRLTIHHATTGDTVAVACDHFEWRDSSYTSSTSATSTTRSVFGCDSVVTLHLTIHHTTAGDTVATACDSFEWHGTSYTNTTSATSTTTNAVGCDSVVTLHLTVNYGTHYVAYQSACDTFRWHDSLYTSSGTFLHGYLSPEGCPSTDTLVLTLSTGTSTGFRINACDGYVWNGTLYTETGNYIYDYSQLGGDCQNVDTLFLTLHYSSYTEVYDTACDSYTWEGTRYTSSTSATNSTNSAFGCDSTVTLHLTIHYNTSTAYSDTLGADSTYSWHGQTYMETGTYLYDYISDEGCPSTDTLYLLPRQYYTLHARSADTVMGYVVVYPDSVALCGDTVIVVGVPHEGFRFTHWSDGDTNGARLVRLTSDTTLVAYFEVFAGIEEAETPAFRLWAETGSLHVEGTGIAGMPVRVYDLTGRLLHNGRAEGDRVTISITHWATGVYLVRVGNLPAQRIVLR
ncbi:MAG: fibronectin type III domain-containing protein [Bacteroidales bacterium]|nr:fibronectin type III domain-containing protein [Bacteroidales bacterium]